MYTRDIKLSSYSL